MLEYSHHGVFVLYLCVLALLPVCACLFVAPACVPICCQCLGGFVACICAHAVYFKNLKVFGPPHQTGLWISEEEAEVQFKARNLQMC